MALALAKNEKSDKESVVAGTALTVSGVLAWSLADRAGGAVSDALRALSYTLAVAGIIVASRPFITAVVRDGFTGVLGVGIGKVDGKEYLLGPNGLGLLLAALPVIAFTAMRL